jgi:hypothetical protein
MGYFDVFQAVRGVAVKMDACGDGDTNPFYLQSIFDLH